ncbi:Major facilitator superfamily domain, general substrate transporter [Niveomyces insectorum RCEF 264]|uniref:Major facilitator superfamily domain, general substrate transporter n=1 Tax=Niveomyces insectorum RCEF 264 TaxID=1081102 RepID=A0A167MP95_9HYPO|nr:Major facilitator superfamily domain, general substrate transporter [Niveomyces insectorum RCEF 264]
MPAMIVMYFLNYLDRQNIASAKLANITGDLHLTDVQYQTCISLLFIGYILMQIPSNMIAGKTSYPAIYICCAMAAWGAVSACTAAVQNFAGLVIRKQMALRTAILFSGSMVGSAFGGLFAIGILTLDGHQGIAGWRWLFLVEGTVTVFVSLIFAFIMPNQLQGVKGFSKEEQAYLYWNFGNDQGQQDDKDELSVTKGIVFALKDPKLWLLLGILYCTYICAASLNFFPSVVSTLGYSRNKTLALTAPPSLLCVPVMLVNGTISDRKRKRFVYVMWPLVMCLISMIIAVSTLNVGARYFAMMLMPSSFYGSAIVTFSWITAAMSQPATKRASAIAIVNALANTPNVWTSYLYYAPPRYTLRSS